MIVHLVCPARPFCGFLILVLFYLSTALCGLVSQDGLFSMDSSCKVHGESVFSFIMNLFFLLSRTGVCVFDSMSFFYQFYFLFLFRYNFLFFIL